MNDLQEELKARLRERQKLTTVSTVNQCEEFGFTMRWGAMWLRVESNSQDLIKTLKEILDKC